MCFSRQDLGLGCRKQVTVPRKSKYPRAVVCPWGSLCVYTLVWSDHLKFINGSDAGLCRLSTWLNNFLTCAGSLICWHLCDNNLRCSFPQEEGKEGITISGVALLTLLVHWALGNHIPEPISPALLWKSVSLLVVNNSLHLLLSAAQEDTADSEPGKVTAW